MTHYCVVVFVLSSSFHWNYSFGGLELPPTHTHTLFHGFSGKARSHLMLIFSLSHSQPALVVLFFRSSQPLTAAWSSRRSDSTSDTPDIDEAHRTLLLHNNDSLLEVKNKRFQYSRADDSLSTFTVNSIRRLMEKTRKRKKQVCTDVLYRWWRCSGGDITIIF